MQCKGSSSNRRYRYTKVLDNRKHPIRGLWRRNGKFIARVSVEAEHGSKAVKWVSMGATTLGEAQDELRTLLVEKKENRLGHIGRSPTFADFPEQTYLPLLEVSGKKHDTI